MKKKFGNLKSGNEFYHVLSMGTNKCIKMGNRYLSYDEIGQVTWRDGNPEVEVFVPQTFMSVKIGGVFMKSLILGPHLVCIKVESELYSKIKNKYYKINAIDMRTGAGYYMNSHDIVVGED